MQEFLWKWLARCGGIPATDEIHVQIEIKTQEQEEAPGPTA